MAAHMTNVAICPHDSKPVLDQPRGLGRNALASQNFHCQIAQAKHREYHPSHVEVLCVFICSDLWLSGGDPGPAICSVKADRRPTGGQPLSAANPCAGLHSLVSTRGS